ncbi:hypothetical protein SAMN05660420_02516 [Desulfuromusa kysingii]|uniref:Autotransporter translocation and assembly factor TamB n=1 Tax=Desulfuromusa kysingii TaxID=37625 RepID=A0A1H4CAA2_9BACT|nr:hypothetical protein [Desulfuromusa kysingii]SEA57250.1 hypothetical protein SAMN05660420_02516 [Desulfuromusa kysingii]
MNMRSVAKLFLCLLCLCATVIPAQSAYYDGSDLGYLDYVTVNGLEYEEYDTRQIIFTSGDLLDGSVLIEGLLESEQKQIAVKDLNVEITLDGGTTWQAADGHSRWRYKFYPEINKIYEFSIRVVKDGQTDLPGELWRIGEFELRTTAVAEAEKLSGQGSIALGWLGSYLPERLLDPESKELLVSFNDLQTQAGEIVSGTVVVATKTTLTLPGAVLQLDRMTFSPTGTSLQGSLELDIQGMSFPNLPLDAINLTLAGLAGDISIANASKPFSFDLIEGTYAVTLVLDALTLQVDTNKDVPFSFSALGGALQLGSGYGNLEVPNLSMLADQSIGWGQAAVAEGAEAVASQLTIPGTAFKLIDIGGAINLAKKSVSLSGKLQFPDSIGGGFVSLPAETPLILSRKGVSTGGTLEFAAGTLPSLNLSGFPTNLSALSLTIADNLPSGSLTGQITLSNFASLPLDIAADINKDGLNSLRMAVEKATNNYTITDFATLSLTRIGLEYAAGDFSVDLDGSITPAGDLISSIEGIGESLVFTGLNIASDAITLADNLAGWHDLSGASVQIEDAVLALSEYGIGVENNKFWVGLKGSGSLAGAEVNATARIFHDGTTEVTGLQLQRLQLAYGDFLLKLDRSAVDANGLVNDATQGVIAGLPQIAIDKFPALFNENNELLVQLNGFNVDLANNKVTLGSVTINPSTALTFDLGPVAMQLTGMTFSSTGAEIAGSVSLAGFDLPATDIPFTGLNFSRSGFAGDVDLVGLAGVRTIDILDGDYGFSLALSALKVAVDTQLPVAQMVQLTGFSGSLQFGPGYGDIAVPNLQLLADHTISWGQTAVAEGEEVVATALLTIPGTDFKLANIGGAINLAAKSVSLHGQFQFPDSLGGGSVSLPAVTPLVLSKKGISTAGTLEFAAGTLPSLDLSGFPTTLSTLSLAIADNIPSGSLSGQVTLNSFADLPLDIAADINKDGLNRFRMAVEKESYSFPLAEFATLTLTKLALEYDKGDFSVVLDGSITPTNSLVSSVTGIDDALVFSGLTISPDAITLASDLEGWHELTGAAAQIEGAFLTLNQYGIGVENNLFWVGLKGQASLGGSTATATARIFHDGTTRIDGIDLNNIYFALGDFFLKVAGDHIDEAGAIANNTQGYIGGLPQALIDALPAGVLNDAQELVVQLNNFQVDLANRSVSLGSVGYIPAAPFNVTLGPVTLSFAGITFTTSSASIDGAINLSGLGLPVEEIPFTDLYLGAGAIAGDIDLIGGGGTRSITIVDGEFGFQLNLDTLSVNVDTRKSLATMVSLKTFGGGVEFGSGFNGLEISDLELLSDNIISWGKNTIAAAPVSLARLNLPGGFAIGDLGGAIDLAAKSLSISGTIYLPAAMNNASITIPADQPVTLSASNGLSTDGPLVFDPGTLPAMSLADIDTSLTSLSLGIDNNVISGSLAGNLDFTQFGNLKVAVTAAFDSKDGLQQVKIDSGNLNKSFNLDGFASLTLKEVKGGYKNDNFYVELAGMITPTHSLFSEYQRPVEFSGLRVYKAAIEFTGDLGGWQTLSATTININAASVSLEKYGLGISNGLLWFGLQGQAEYMGGEASITAKIFHDKTFEISDFGFDGLYLALGDFSLRTSAKMEDGLISGAGSINAGFLTEYLPAELKDPLTGEVNVSFENLAIDLENKKVTSGTVVLNFKKALTPDLGVFSAEIRSVSFGSNGASVDGDFNLDSLAGIDIPNAPKNLSFADIELSPRGFAGSVTYNAGSNPVVLPVLTGDYGITLRLSELTVAVDTSAAEIVDMLRLTDLDGSIKLGSGYEMAEDFTQLTMLADRGITWGMQPNSDLADMGKEAAEQAAKEAAESLSGLDFKIPGTEFHVNNINGRLYLNDKKLKVWGRVKLPANLGGGSIGLSEVSALVVSSSGVSTTGEVDIDPGSIGKFGLAGFAADVQSFSFGVSSNSISGSLAATIKLVQFDNIPIDVTASLSNLGLEELTIVTELPESPFSLAGFADLTLKKLGGSYVDGEINVIIDGDLALDPTVADVAKTFNFSDLSISKNSISMPSIDDPVMFAADLPAFSVGEGLAQLALSEFGFTVKDNLMWIILNGNATILSQTVEGSILISHKGDIDLGTLRADDIVVNFGDYRLTGALALVDGEWSGEASLYLGALHSSLDPSSLNAFGELPVSVSNLDIDMDSKTLNSGTISFDPEGSFTISNDFFNASLPSVSVGVRGGSVFGEIGAGASISFDQGILAGYTEGLSFSDFGLANNGLQVTVTWADTVGKSMTVVPHTTYGIDAHLKEIKVAFDSSKGDVTEMFELKKIDGNLSFGDGYSMASVANGVTNLTPAIVFDNVENTYGFNAVGLAFNLPGTDLQVRDFSGDIGFDDQSLTLAGTLTIPYAEGKQIDISINEWTISDTGFKGEVSANNVDLADIGFDAMLTEANLAFDKFSIASASLGMELTLEEFFAMKIAAKLALANNGVSAWSIGGSSAKSFTHEAPFATVTVSGLNAGYHSAGDNPGLYFGLDSSFAIKGATLLSGLPSPIILSGIEVSDSGITIDGVVIETGFNGASATLAGAKVDLTTFALGYDDHFFFDIAGGISAGPIAADVVLTLHQNATIDLEKIVTEYHEGSLYFKVELGLSESEFSGAVIVDVANTISMDGQFILGSTDTYTYWGASLAAGGSGGVPLGAIPLSLYKVGGGCAYHMTVNAETGALTKDGNNPFVLMAKVGIGTSDFSTWYGDFTLYIEDSKLTLHGDSWFLTESHTGDADLEATITLGSSPPLFHVEAEAKLSKKLGSLTMLGVDGTVDLLFADGDWHIWFGSQDQRLNVTALEYITGSGYIQLSSDGLALGVKQTFDLGGEWWIFYGRIYGGAEVAVEGGFAPFYIDASGRVWIGLEAGVRVGGENYEIMAAYAELDAHFRAPNPTYVMMHGEVSYSFLMGVISGSWEMDFVIPEGTEGATMEANIADLPLLAMTRPQNNATKVRLVNELEISTTIPLMHPFVYDDDNWYVLTVKHPERDGDIVNFTEIEDGNKGLLLDGYSGAMRGGLLGLKKMVYSPLAPLSKGQEHSISTVLQLRTFNPTTSGSTITYGADRNWGSLVKEEVVTVSFTTTDEPTNFREMVLGVYPSVSTAPVYADTNVYLEMKNALAAEALRDGQERNKIKINVLDPSGTPVSGAWDFGGAVTDDQGGSQRSIFVFKSTEPLYIMKSYTNAEGVTKYSKQLPNGVWPYPFITEPETNEGDTSQTQAGSTTQGKQLERYVAQIEKGTNQKQRGQTSKRRNRAGSGADEADVDENSAEGGVTVVGGGVMQVAAGPTYIGNGIGGAANEYVLANDRVGAVVASDGYQNKYTVEILDEGNQKIYGANFYLTLPENGEEPSAMYSGSKDVIADGGLENLNYFVKYSLDQAGYQEALAAGPYAAKREELRALWERYINGEFSSVGSLCQPPEMVSLTNLRNAFDNNEQNVQNDLEQCAPAASVIEEIEGRVNLAKEELALTFSTVNFQTLELRFTTKAPINWNEIELEIEFDPAVDEGSYSITFRKGQYIVRSKSDSINHRIEMKFTSDYERQLMERLLFRISNSTYGYHVVDYFGGVKVFTRDFTESLIGADYNYAQDEAIGNTTQYQGNNFSQFQILELETSRGTTDFTSLSF